MAKRNPKRAAEARAWKSCSRYIRARDIKRFGSCWCGCKRKIECAMHRIPRTKQWIKYDEENILGGSHFCNSRDRFSDRDFFTKRFIEIFGQEKYLGLVNKSDPRDADGRRILCKRSIGDFIDIENEYNKKYEDLAFA